MSEAGNMWVTVRRHLAPHGRLVRVENAEAGTLDVYYNLRGATGWLELKHLAALPARLNTTVRVKDLTLGQVQWLEEEAAEGGRAHLLLNAGRGWYLLDSAGARALYEGTITVASLRFTSKCYDYGGIKPLIPAILRRLRG